MESMSHCVKMTKDQASKVCADKTRIELEKLNKTIKDTDVFNKPERYNPSESESDCESTGSNETDLTYVDEEEVKYVSKRPRSTRTTFNIGTIYRDNQILWKKTAKIKYELERTNKELRYLQMAHNNKCIDVTNLIQERDKLNLEVSQRDLRLKILRSKFIFYLFQLFLAYGCLVTLIAEYKYDYHLF